MIGPFKKRSSVPSNFLTSVIGWIAYVVMMQMFFGSGESYGLVFQVALVTALIHMAAYLSFLTPMKLSGKLFRGMAVGALSGAIVFFGVCHFFKYFESQLGVLIGNGLITGLLVGGIVAYFYGDDARIETEAKAKGVPINYGRDSHWLDPFVYGIAAFLICFWPRTAEVALTSAVMGMMTGVVAAAFSHFLLSRWDNSPRTLPFAILGGALFGFLFSPLFRKMTDQLWFAPATHMMIAGALTFLVTASVAIHLAKKERESEA